MGDGGGLVAGRRLTCVGAIGLAGVGAGGQEQAALPGNEQRAPDAPGGRRSSELPIDFDSPEALGRHTERRVNAARQRLNVQRAYDEAGRITIDRYIDASEQLMLAELAASANEGQRVPAAKANMDRITELVKLEEEKLLNFIVTLVEPLDCNKSSPAGTSASIMPCPFNTLGIGLGRLR